MQALDTGYLSEFGTRLQAQTEEIKRIYKEAYENGDTDKMVEAQQALAQVTNEQARYNTAKSRQEQQAKTQVEMAQQQQQPQQQQMQGMQTSQPQSNRRAYDPVGMQRGQQGNLMQQQGGQQFAPSPRDQMSDTILKLINALGRDFHTSSNLRRNRVEVVRSHPLATPHPAVLNRGAGRSS